MHPSKARMVWKARKRRAKMMGREWTKVSKRGAAVDMWVRDMPERRIAPLREKDIEAQRPIGGPTSERKPTQGYVSEMIDKLLGHTRY